MATKSAKAPDLTEFYQLAAKGNHKKPCQIGLAREQLDLEDRVNLDGVFGDEKHGLPSGFINVGAVRDWLAKRGHKVSVPAITSHQKGTCSCDGS